MTDAPHPRRRTFVPVVLLGLTAGVVAAIAGTQTWVSVEGYASSDGSAAYTSSLSLVADSGQVPAANALALVGLACWGVVLVTRGRFRRYVAALGLTAALGTLVTVVIGFGSAARDVRSAFEDIGVTGEVYVSPSAWFWIGAVAALISLAAWVVAVRFVRHWPEMGTRYDRPVERSEDDLWKALDQGHDPTS